MVCSTFHRISWSYFNFLPWSPCCWFSVLIRALPKVMHRTYHLRLVINVGISLRLCLSTWFLFFYGTTVQCRSLDSWNLISALLGRTFSNFRNWAACNLYCSLCSPIWFRAFQAMIYLSPCLTVAGWEVFWRPHAWPSGNTRKYFAYKHDPPLDFVYFVFYESCV